MPGCVNSRKTQERHSYPVDLHGEPAERCPLIRRVMAATRIGNERMAVGRGEGKLAARMVNRHFHCREPFNSAITIGYDMNFN